MPIENKNPTPRAPRNRTLTLTAGEADRFRDKLRPEKATRFWEHSRIILGDAGTQLPALKAANFDLLFCDPPYNLTKRFGQTAFKSTTSEAYEEWLESWLKLCVPLLKPTASVYICGDWRSASAIQRVGSKYFQLQNRITWEREKGRGAKAN